MCVHPLHTLRTFSPSNSERFRRVGEDRNGSAVVSWPCLLLPHRNKSPSPVQTTGTASVIVQQRQNKARTVNEWWPDIMIHEHVDGFVSEFSSNVFYKSFLGSDKCFSQTKYNMNTRNHDRYTECTNVLPVRHTQCADPAVTRRDVSFSRPAT